MAAPKRKRKAAPPAPKIAPAEAGNSAAETEGLPMPPGLWALAAFYICLLVPAVGLSLGVVYASQPAKRQRRFGWFCMAAGILVYLARLGMEGAADQGSLVEPYY